MIVRIPVGVGSRIQKSLVWIGFRNDVASHYRLMETPNNKRTDSDSPNQSHSCFHYLFRHDTPSVPSNIHEHFPGIDSVSVSLARLRNPMGLNGSPHLNITAPCRVHTIVDKLSTCKPLICAHGYAQIGGTKPTAGPVETRSDPRAVRRDFWLQSAVH